MFRFIKIAALVVGVALVSGCMEKACTSTGSCIETVTAGAAFRGTEETLVEVTIKGKEPTHLVHTSEPLGKGVIRAVAPVFVGGVISGEYAKDIAREGKCNTQAGPDGVNYGCGNTILSAQGGKGGDANSAATNVTSTRVDAQLNGSVQGGCPTCALIHQ